MGPSERTPQRDGAAFAAMVAAHLPELFSCAASVLLAPSAAETAVRDALDLAWAESGRVEEPVGPFLKRLLCRVLMGRAWSRREKSDAVRLGPRFTRQGALRGRTGEWPVDLGAHDPQGMKRAVATTVSSLPGRERVAWALCDLWGVSVADIASAGGADEGEVRREIHDVRLAMLECLETFAREGRQASRPLGNTHHPSWAGV
jgi:DNA-directed RNA polymerase specialized sigma24 family protein